jgi:hypothetical protein
MQVAWGLNVDRSRVKPVKMGKYEGNAGNNLHCREYTTTRGVVDVGVQATRSRRY